MATKLTDMNIAMAFPLKIVSLEKGKKAMTTSKKMLNCFTNLLMISTGVVKRKTS